MRHQRQTKYRHCVITNTANKTLIFSPILRSKARNRLLYFSTRTGLSWPETNAESGMLLKLFFVFMTLLLASLTQGCAQVDVKRMTYEALRKQDCLLNEINTFCDRSYSLEYLEYAQLRREFLREEQQVNDIQQSMNKTIDIGSTEQ